MAEPLPGGAHHVAQADELPHAPLEDAVPEPARLQAEMGAAPAEAEHVLPLGEKPGPRLKDRRPGEEATLRTSPPHDADGVEERVERQTPGAARRRFREAETPQARHVAVVDTPNGDHAPSFCRRRTSAFCTWRFRHG